MSTIIDSLWDPTECYWDPIQCYWLHFHKISKFYAGDELIAVLPSGLFYEQLVRWGMANDIRPIGSGDEHDTPSMTFKSEDKEQLQDFLEGQVGHLGFFSEGQLVSVEIPMDHWSEASAVAFDGRILAERVTASGEVELDSTAEIKSGSFPATADVSVDGFCFPALGDNNAVVLWKDLNPEFALKVMAAVCQGTCYSVKTKLIV